MKAGIRGYAALLVMFFVAIAVETGIASAGVGKEGKLLSCPPLSPCYYNHRNVRCPAECPSTRPANPYAKFCYLDCYSRKCEAICKKPKRECDGKGSGCYVLSCPRLSPCYYNHRNVRCPAECPSTRPANPYAKFCYLDCYSRKCEVICKNPKRECDDKGSGCYDPRFVGGDGVVFYFHGKKDEHFSLVSDTLFQINARLIGLRPAGRTRDFTWIQALGFMFGSHRFTVDATRAERWDDAVDHLQFFYDGEALELSEGHRSSWSSSDGELTVERMGRTNSVMVKLEGMAEASVTVVPVTEEDDRIHKYHIPSDDCFAHLEVQFRFHGLSPEVEGLLGRTYQPDYVSPAKRGVAMPVLGGEDKYWTPSLLSPQCNACVFTPAGTEASVIVQVAEN